MPPEIIAPAIAPRRAPTIPPQKRSGRNTVKCQSERPTTNQTSTLISAVPPVLAAAALLASALLARGLRRPLGRRAAGADDIGLSGSRRGAVTVRLGSLGLDRGRGRGSRLFR